MKKIKDFVLRMSFFAATCGLTGLAESAPQSGVASFINESQTYKGQYTVKNQSIWVNIDGLVYRGNYAANALEVNAASGGPPVGSWGRAFLFASSAKVLQCQLDSGFPKVSGRCQSADGRTFDLKPGVAGLASRATSAKVKTPPS